MKNNKCFGEAVAALKAGHRVMRSGWNGKGMFLFLVVGQAVTAAINERYGSRKEQEDIPVMDAIYMQTADGRLVPWLASQTDILSNDWQVL